MERLTRLTFAVQRMVTTIPKTGWDFKYVSPIICKNRKDNSMTKDDLRKILRKKMLNANTIHTLHLLS